jgi:cytoskeletal protein RodZ
VFEIGNSLREARLRQQLDFPEIEQATKIRAKYLRALEEEAFEALPAQTYVKGFLRVYADYLGLDGQLYVDEFNSRYVTGEDDVPVVRPARRHRGTAFGRIERRSVALVLVAIAVVTALVIAAWKFGQSPKQALPPVSPTTTKRRPQAPTGPTTRKKAPPAVARLVLHATSGSCWVQVFRGSALGHQVYVGTIEPGQTLPLRGTRFYMRVGNPPALTATVNGRPQTWPSQTAVNVIVTAAGIRRAPTTA